ncbi:hypothetical protein H8356DRAFT_1418403 [Neocallimastix lanati (nom. inval.)]|nr:hypothetical protein H8356DRAFT_1418403 [Neocallimastix sp. JGI-2020a]
MIYIYMYQLNSRYVSKQNAYITYTTLIYLIRTLLSFHEYRGSNMPYFRILLRSYTSTFILYLVDNQVVLKLYMIIIKTQNRLLSCIQCALVLAQASNQLVL